MESPDDQNGCGCRTDCGCVCSGEKCLHSQYHRDGEAPCFTDSSRQSAAQAIEDSQEDSHVQTADGKQVGETCLPVSVDDFCRKQFSFSQNQRRSPAFGNRLPATGEVLSQEVKDPKQIFIGVRLSPTPTGHFANCSFSFIQLNLYPCSPADAQQIRRGFDDQLSLKRAIRPDQVIQLDS